MEKGGGSNKHVDKDHFSKRHLQEAGSDQIQYNTAQFNTTQHSTIQYNIIQCINFEPKICQVLGQEIVKIAQKFGGCLLISKRVVEISTDLSAYVGPRELPREVGKQAAVECRNDVVWLIHVGRGVSIFVEEGPGNGKLMPWTRFLGPRDQEGGEGEGKEFLVSGKEIKTFGFGNFVQNGTRSS